MSKRNPFKTKLENLFIAAFIFTLSACAGGGAVGPSGGPSAGGPVGAEGVNAPPGGGANANYSSGPVSLPAPTMVSTAPENTLNAMLINCTNIVGPDVECKGGTNSSPKAATLRLAVYPPGMYGTVPPIGGLYYPVTANDQGAWTKQLPAGAGQVIEVCLIQSSLCKEALYITVPPEGGTVDGTMGVMKNLTIDSHGNAFYSKNDIPEAKRAHAWSWTSLFISEAEADEISPALIPVIPEPVHIAPFAEPKKVGMKVAAAKCVDSQPASSFAVELMRSGPGFNANEALIHKYDPTVGFLNAFFTIPNTTRDEIKGMAAWETFGASGEKIPYLVVALKDHVFLINYKDAPFIEQRINFPNDMEVSQIFPGGPDIYVFLTHNASTRSADQIYPLYRIRQLYNYTARNYYGQDVEALCVPRSHDHELQELANVFQFDAQGERFALVGRTLGNQYQVIAGNPEILGDVTDYDPIAFKTVDHPVEVRILNQGDFNLDLAILDPAQKTLEILSYDRTAGPGESPVTSQVTRLEDLGLNGLNYPRLLTVDPASKQLAFLDIAEAGTKIVSLGYAVDGTNVALKRDTPTVYNAGGATPTILRRIDNAWGYNDRYGQILKAQLPSLDPSVTTVDNPVTERVRSLAPRVRIVLPGEIAH